MQKEAFYDYLQHPEKLNSTSLDELKQVVESYPAFQSAWILLLKNMKMLDHPEFENYLEQGAIRIADRRKLYHFLHQEEAEQELEPVAEPQEELDPLAKEYMAPGYYLLDAPRETKQEESLVDLIRSIRKTEPPKPDTSPDISGEEQAQPEADHSFVTETLAKIYWQQKHYKKAIQAYEKLSLKYPEKNTYFAGQIEKLKKITN